MRNLLLTAVAFLLSLSSYAIGPITGTPYTCLGSSVTLADTAIGGSWSSANPAIAAVGTTGTVTGMSVGVTTISYTRGAAFAIVSFTVMPTPTAITGSSIVCLFSTTPLSCATSGGTWSSSSAIIATIDMATGVAFGSTAGTCVITYSLPSGCNTTKVITVTSTTSPGSITGAYPLCIGSSLALYETVAGGTWSSGTTTIASVNATTGVVTGIAAGTATISYAVSGCSGIAYATTVVTVIAPPAAITGTTTVCEGSSVTLSCPTPGGTWESSNTSIATVGTTGAVYGASAGVSTIDYMLSTGCMSSILVTVNPQPLAITGLTSICTGGTTTLADATPGGVWSSSNPAVASISAGGTLNGLALGTSTISYVLSTGCGRAITETVLSGPSAIAGPANVCVGAWVTLINTGGGTWSSSDPTIASIVPTTGAVLGIATGTTTITYSLGSGCSTTSVETVSNTFPTISIASTSACGGTSTYTASGGLTYTWAPVSGLSCTNCSATVANPFSTTVYTVTGTNALGCSATASVSYNGNRIAGNITLGGSSTALKIWLIKYDPTDSSITALDSTTACLASGVPYYEFLSPAAGNYLVKAKLTTSIPGTSDYIPTYGNSTVVWYGATTIYHTSSLNTENINMIHGTVPAGPGFVGGYVYAGAGRGTTGDAPVNGMLIFLKDPVTGLVLTYTYTDATGAYSFGGLAVGNYVVAPEEYRNHTIPSSVITLSSSAPAVTGISFRQYNDSRIIKPITTNGIEMVNASAGITLFPNPANGKLNISWNNQAAGQAKMTITDMAGRVVYTGSFDLANAVGITSTDISSLNNGIYMVHITGAAINYNSKLIVE